MTAIFRNSLLVGLFIFLFSSCVWSSNAFFASPHSFAPDETTRSSGSFDSLEPFCKTRMHAAAAPGGCGVPFGLAWDDAPEKAQNLLKKHATNIRGPMPDDLHKGLEVVDARRYYDNHPFTIRCIFSQKKLIAIGILSTFVAYKNNLQRARELAARFFIKPLDAHCVFMGTERQPDGEIRSYKSAHSDIQVQWKNMKKSARIVVLYRRLAVQDDIFNDSLIFSAENEGIFLRALKSANIAYRKAPN